MKRLIEIAIEKVKAWLKSPGKPKIEPVIGNELKYMTTAFQEVGTKEMSNGENPRIVLYFTQTTYKATTDETPWCAAFVCWCLETSGFKSTKSATARSFLDWGKPCGLRYGAIAVFDRGQGRGHVGFVDTWDEATITLLGGNQSNQVCFKKYPRSLLLGLRMPEEIKN